MNDLIRRQTAVDALCKSECGLNNAECRHKDDTDFCVTCDNVKIIKSLPSIQPERKTGRWIHKELNHFCCDQCETLFVVLIGTGELHFCPNCGADMRGEGVI